MASFLTTHNVASAIDDIIRKAEQVIGIVSPYLQFSDAVAHRLRDADRSGKKIVVIYGKQEDLHSSVEDILNDLNGVKLFYCDNLHAKCYFNESEIVITSMNLYEYSEKNNREMGVRAEEGEAIYEEALAEVYSIQQASEERDLSTNDHPLQKIFGSPMSGKSAQATTGTAVDKLVSGDGSTSNAALGDGYCIRCAASIPHDPARPFCKDCFKKWVRWENPEYEEDYCHTCGEPHETSKERPQCKPCWRKTRYN